MLESIRVFAKIIGKTIISIKQEKLIYYCNEILTFTFSDGTIWTMYHDQDCCETVEIESIVGELDWLLNTPLLMAEEVINIPEIKGNDDSQTWTFYKFATIRGYVTIRWLGQSNGYYSETVTFKEVLQS